MPYENYQNFIKYEKVVANASNEYNRVLDDAWKLAWKIAGDAAYGAYDCDELYEIFGTGEVCDVFARFTCQEALTKIQAYEKRKEEESAKPVLGDIVIFKCDNVDDFKGIYIANDACNIWALINGYAVPQSLDSDLYSMEKTGEHVDIQGILDTL